MDSGEQPLSGRIAVRCLLTRRAQRLLRCLLCRLLLCLCRRCGQRLHGGASSVRVGTCLPKDGCLDQHASNKSHDQDILTISTANNSKHKEHNNDNNDSDSDSYNRTFHSTNCKYYFTAIAVAFCHYKLVVVVVRSWQPLTVVSTL